MAIRRLENKFYQKMNEIMNDKPSVSLPLVLDTSAVNKEQSDNTVDAVPEINFKMRL